MTRSPLFYKIRDSIQSYLDTQVKGNMTFTGSGGDVYIGKVVRGEISEHAEKITDAVLEVALRDVSEKHRESTKNEKWGVSEKSIGLTEEEIDKALLEGLASLEAGEMTVVSPEFWKNLRERVVQSTQRK